MQKKKLAIVGYGDFGRFIKTHLDKYFDVLVYSSYYEGASSLQEIIVCDYIVFALTMDKLESVCKEMQHNIDKKSIIIDVCSVKVKPLYILKQYFPNNQILGTHPIFGPQSGRDGIEGLPIVLSNVSLDTDTYEGIKKFLTEKLSLNTIELSPVEHDKQMSYVQGLSHFIGRALEIMDIKEYDTATKSYKQLISLKNLLGNDSWELYKTIQNHNPYTEKVRNDFLHILNNLEQKIKE